MAKKKRKKFNNKIENSKALRMQFKILKERGKLKGKNKKETEALKHGCVHLKPKKNGKYKPTFIIFGDQAVCKICKAHFPARLLEKSHLNEVYDEAISLADQGTYLASAVNAGPDTLDSFATCKVLLYNIKKAHKRLTKIARKKQDISRKKKSVYAGNTQNNYGYWSTNNK